MPSLTNKLTHLGLNYVVRRSTLSDANKRRDSSFFAAIYAYLYHKFSEREITYVTKLKKSAKHRQIAENEMPEGTDDAVIIDELVEFRFGEKKESRHRARHIAYWDDRSGRVVEYLTNNFELSPNEIVEIYRRRWQIETLFKQMKQNFQLKYFLGDNVNALECQVWVAMIANLLLSIIKSGVERVCSYTGIVSLIRLQLMSYISLYDIDMLEKPEKSWLDLLKRQKQEFTGMLFDT